jgi:hypothetical protein
MQELNRALAAAVRGCDAQAAAAAVAAGADPLQSIDGTDALSIAAAAEPVPHGQIAKAVVSHTYSSYYIGLNIYIYVYRAV